MTRMIIKHAALRAAFRWYSEAVVSSSAAPEVSTAMLEMFDSILSVLVLSPTDHKDQATEGNGERQHPLVRRLRDRSGMHGDKTHQSCHPAR